MLKSKDQTEDWNQFILQGDMNALSRIYFQCYDLLFSYGLKHTSDKQVVENAIQNVFMNLIISRKSIGDVKNLTGYLICTFRRQLFLELNKQKKTVLTKQIPEEQFNFFKSPEQDVSNKENLEQIHVAIKQCIENLTSKQQEIIYLRFENEIPYEKISEMLNISVDSCYKLLYRSIKKIRLEVEKIISKKENLIFWLLFRHSPKMEIR